MQNELDNDLLISLRVKRKAIAFSSILMLLSIFVLVFFILTTPFEYIFILYGLFCIVLFFTSLVRIKTLYAYAHVYRDHIAFNDGFNRYTFLLTEIDTFDWTRYRKKSGTVLITTKDGNHIEFSSSIFNNIDILHTIEENLATKPIMETTL